MSSSVTQEGYIAVTGGRVWYQIVGAGSGIPLLTLHGGPGFPHDYLEPLGALADERPVIFYDQLGCGLSDQPDDPSLWRLERFVEELGQLRQALGLTQVHLFGHSGGTMLALDYLLTQPTGVVSLIQACPVLSISQVLTDINRLYASLPGDVWAAIKRLEAEGAMESEEYQKGVEAYAQRYMARLPSEPEASRRAREKIGIQVAQTMWGPYELQVTGNLKDYDRTARAAEVAVPTLFFCGRYDFCTPEATAQYHRCVAGSELVILEQSSHSPFYEEPEHFLAVIRDFLRRVEAR